MSCASESALRSKGVSLPGLLSAFICLGLLQKFFCPLPHRLLLFFAAAVETTQHIVLKTTALSPTLACLLKTPTLPLSCALQCSRLRSSPYSRTSLAARPRPYPLTKKPSVSGNKAVAPWNGVAHGGRVPGILSESLEKLYFLCWEKIVGHRLQAARGRTIAQGETARGQRLDVVWVGRFATSLDGRRTPLLSSPLLVSLARFCS